MFDINDDAKGGFRRVEVLTGPARRRRWSAEDKARIVTEIAVSGESVSAVARRHGLSPQQLFGWRRQLRESQAEPCEADRLQFVPAVVDVASPASTVRRQRPAPPAGGMIEVEIDGVTIRVGHGADAKTLIAVLRALKAGA